jgi:hypothetical protein
MNSELLILVNLVLNTDLKFHNFNEITKLRTKFYFITTNDQYNFDSHDEAEKVLFQSNNESIEEKRENVLDQHVTVSLEGKVILNSLDKNENDELLESDEIEENLETEKNSE